MGKSPDLVTCIDLGDRRAPVEARINRRARRLIVKVDSLHGIVHLTAPSRRGLRDAVRFAEERAAWIRNELAAGPKAHPFEIGGFCPYAGVPHRIMAAGGPRAPVRRFTQTADATDVAPNRVMVGGEPAHVNRRVCDWLKREARQTLTARAGFYAGQLGRPHGRIRVNDTRSRWASCSDKGTLSFSWRLILAPPAILDYVAAHECAHLVHMNHSKAYWQVLAGLGVDARAARQWFQHHGPRLFSYGVPHAADPAQSSTAEAAA
ncbi:MAG: SprT family zinc-dependent metalloprotease [Pseudomonadota bacterium]